MKDQPTIILRRTRQGLTPVSAIDEEALSEYALGSDVEVVIRKRRSGPQHRMYWKVLGNTVAATNKWPTAKHLHRNIKMALGYVEETINGFTGEVEYHEDSTAFAKMDGIEFQNYFNQAMELIAKTCGFDPLADYEQRKAS
jgi:hypothetical protein